MGRLISDMDSEQRHFGSGWISGMLSIVLGVAGNRVVPAVPAMADGGRRTRLLQRRYHSSGSARCSDRRVCFRSNQCGTQEDETAGRRRDGGGIDPAIPGGWRWVGLFGVD
jgi:hypothetical protein